MTYRIITTDRVGNVFVGTHDYPTVEAAEEGSRWIEEWERKKKFPVLSRRVEETAVATLEAKP